MRRALLVVNRRSREGEADLERGIELLRQDGLAVVEHYVENPAAIPEMIRRERGEVDLVIVGGGDGTLNTAVQAVAESGLPLGILPMGTANDLARTLGIPKELSEACRVIADGRLHRIDLGWVNGRLFFNVASIGLAVMVTHRLSSEKKSRWGILAFLPALVQALRENRSFAVEIVCDGRTVRHRSIQVAVGNGRHYGAGLTIAEDARIDDHQLHLYSLEPLGFWALLRLAPAFRLGRFPRQREVRLMSGRNIEVRTRQPLPVDTDGELTTHTPASFRVLQRRLPVFVPEEYLATSGAPPHAA